MGLIKPRGLIKGDKIAAITLSWGGAAEVPHRYKAGVRQLEDSFGVQVVPTKHALKSDDWIYKNPMARADDLMTAFANPEIKGIVSMIGGEDSIRIVPHVDLNVISNNPKVFMGYSDTTVSHLICHKAGLSTFYGPSILAGFAENGGMFPYMTESVERTLFRTEPIGMIQPNHGGWTREFLDWQDVTLQSKRRKLSQSEPWKFINGQDEVTGELIGGCSEVLEILKGTSVWPELNEWEGKILFLENSEDGVSPLMFRCWLRNYAATGVLKKLKGILFARPGGNIPPENFKLYDDELLKVVRDEEGIEIPIITGMDFGHTDPMFLLPYGAKATIRPKEKSFFIQESGVV